MGRRALDWRADPTLADEPIGRQFAPVSVINARVCFVDDGLEPERIMQCDALLALPAAALGNLIRASDVLLRPFLVDRSRRRKGKVTLARRPRAFRQVVRRWHSKTRLW
jgi:hypothetical protein